MLDTGQYVTERDSLANKLPQHTGISAWKKGLNDLL